MEMKLCFIEVKREVWDDWREPLKRASKGAHHVNLVWLWDQVSSFIYKNTIELWVMEIENSQNVFSVSITHNSKIKELSDGNRVMETELSFAKRILSYGSHHFWVMSYGTENWVTKIGNPNSL